MRIKNTITAVSSIPVSMVTCLVFRLLSMRALCRDRITIKTGNTVRIFVGSSANLDNSKDSPDTSRNQMKARGVKLTRLNKVNTTTPRIRAKFLNGLNCSLLSPSRATPTSKKDNPTLRKINTSE